MPRVNSSGGSRRIRPNHNVYRRRRDIDVRLRGQKEEALECAKWSFRHDGDAYAAMGHTNPLERHPWTSATCATSFPLIHECDFLILNNLMLSVHAKSPFYPSRISSPWLHVVNLLGQDNDLFEVWSSYSIVKANSR